MKRLYLAGPMAGLGYASASTWREKVTEGLSDIAECLSPLRGEMLSNGVYSATATNASVFNTQNAIIGRDRADCCGSNLIFMNLLGAKKVSIGTMVELAWADGSRVPIIVCIEKNGNPHDSEYVRGLATYVVSSLEEGIAVARCFFNAPQKPKLKVGDRDSHGRLVLSPVDSNGFYQARSF